MKNFLAAAGLLVFLGLSQAATLEQPNQAGGKIILTGRPCARPGFSVLREAYTYESNGAMGLGCWTLLDGLVHIAWQGGGRSIFPVESFTSNPGETPPVAKPSARSL